MSVDIKAVREVLAVCNQSVKEIKATPESFEAWKITRRYVTDNNLEWLRDMADELEQLRAERDAMRECVDVLRRMCDADDTMMNIWKSDGKCLLAKLDALESEGE